LVGVVGSHFFVQVCGGMPNAPHTCMIAKCLEDLQILQQSVDAADAITAIIERPSFHQDLSLKDQLRKASGKVPSHIAEGFGQKTDRHFASYLCIARGSCNEVRTHVQLAKFRKYITAPECRELSDRYVRIGKGTTRLIQHLRREDRKERG